MKKTFALLLALVLCLGILSGCSQSPAPAGTAPQAPQNTQA